MGNTTSRRRVVAQPVRRSNFQDMGPLAAERQALEDRYNAERQALDQKEAAMKQQAAGGELPPPEKPMEAAASAESVPAEAPPPMDMAPPPSKEAPPPSKEAPPSPDAEAPPPPPPAEGFCGGSMYGFLRLVVLFFALSPGVLLTLPPIGKTIWMTGKTSPFSAFIHSLVFGFVLSFLGIVGTEGFGTKVNGAICSSNYDCRSNYCQPWIGRFKTCVQGTGTYGWYCTYNEQCGRNGGRTMTCQNNACK